MRISGTTKNRFKINAHKPTLVYFNPTNEILKSQWIKYQGKKTTQNQQILKLAPKKPTMISFGFPEHIFSASFEATNGWEEEEGSLD